LESSTLTIWLTLQNGEDKMKIHINFNRTTVEKPVIAETIIKTGVPVNIEQAMIDGEEGWALITIDNNDAPKFLKSLEPYNVIATIQKNAINHNPKECVDCGLCISICQKHVFSFNKDWSLKVEEDKCVLCGRCATFCPQRALSIQSLK